MKKLLLAHLAFLFTVSVIAQSKPDTTSADVNNYFKPLKWRCIGPFRGGRSVCATGVVGNPMVYYMGTTGGGVWKTEDMGITWNNISDGFFKTGSVGAVAVAESDPNVVYAGMGEHAVRGVMSSYGDGVYKSTDAGKTWKKIGLDLTQHIARIVIHPKDPNIIYVAAQGQLYGKSKERGIYKSTDGGVTWKNVLFVNEKTGCNELSIDVNNPRILYASMWEHGREPWRITSGGPGSGLYKSTDGGDHWDRMTEGLPKEMGKMAIAVCRSNSDKVYALIESDWEKEAQGLYVSNDAGKSWQQVSSDHRLIQRAWYYIEVFPDPNNENTVYVMSAPAMKSTDGGKTWENMSTMHGDHHNLWINPNNSNNMIISDDGGSAISFNAGKSWSTLNNQPTAQMYRINVDNLFPYNIYGGQQDNSSVKIASRELGSYGITERSWSYSAGGESAFLAFNPDDPQYVMGGSYQGTIEVLDTKAKGSTNIMAAPIQYLSKDAKDMKYRFNWNAPIICSKFEPNVFYHGAQLLLKTTDYGKTWTEASPDLTRNEKEKQGKPGVPYTNEAVGAENYGTLAYVMESPLEKGVIWTGSDDGYVYVTRDNGATWKNVTPAGLQECLVNCIEVSPFDKATAYIATTRYKFNDHTPGLYKTTDYGKTWTKISNGIPYGAYTRTIREDEKRKDLLFAGTELGLYVSWNGGKDWSPFGLNLPVVPITDLKVYRDNLIAATMGRSYWILDDMSLLRQYKKGDSAMTLFQPTPAYLVNGYSDMDNAGNDFKGVTTSYGINPATGVVLYYQLPDVKDAIVTMEIKDADGNIVRTFSSRADSTYKAFDGAAPRDPVLSKSKGLNKFVWNMRCATIPGVPYADLELGLRGHKVPPGKYTVILKMGTQSVSAAIEILPNPLYATTATEYKEYHSVMGSMEAEVTIMHKMINTINAKREQLETLISNLPADDKFAAVKKDAADLVKKMKAWDEDMVQRKSKTYDDVENFPNKFTSDYLYLINQTESDIARINKPNLDLLKEMNAKWVALKQRGEEILNTNLPALNKQLADAGVGPVWIK
ncbi:MAG: glycosyl hydrolase [Sphingobacteriales bacterium]|nr:MAG: glycosyl hydrolase [Sphingobacteriales bacterium]